MINSSELREQCAQQLLAAAGRVPNISAFVGLDGFVDEILHVVDKRESADRYTRLTTIAQFAQRLAAAAGKSTNLELVTQMTKLGGNGPIMANALASFGLRVTYVGALGYPHLHPVFAGFAQRAAVHTVADPGLTDAYEFEDGKVMAGKHSPLKEVTWPNIQTRYGRDKFTAGFNTADLVGFVNWTMIPNMSQIWEALLTDLCPHLNGRRRMFVDLADPEKREPKDIARALELIVQFQKHFDVILGLNEKEADEIAKVLGLETDGSTPEALGALSQRIFQKVPVSTLVVHPVQYALAIDAKGLQTVKGPYVAKPLITTGAGDHFNSGFCLGKLLGFENAFALMMGVATSGYYVRNAQSPNPTQLASMLRNWSSD